MSLTIFATHLWAELPVAQLKKILEKNTVNGLIDAQGVFNEVDSFGGWHKVDENHSQTAVDTSYEEIGSFFLPDHRKAGLCGLFQDDDDDSTATITVIIAPHQVQEPADIVEMMRRHEDEIRTAIEDNLRVLLVNNGGKINIEADDYHGYPSVYSVNANCSIIDFQGAYIKKNHRIGLLVGPYDKRSVSGDPIRQLPIDELLQVWEILITQKKK